MMQMYGVLQYCTCMWQCWPCTCTWYMYVILHSKEYRVHSCCTYDKEKRCGLPFWHVFSQCHWSEPHSTWTVSCQCAVVNKHTRTVQHNSIWVHYELQFQKILRNIFSPIGLSHTLTDFYLFSLNCLLQSSLFSLPYIAECVDPFWSKLRTW